MSILPEEFKNAASIMRRDVADLDLPVPASFADERERSEWRIYAQSLPLAKKLEKFGQAVDAVIATPEADQAAYTLKLHIAYTVFDTFSDAFAIETKKVHSERFNTDFSRIMYGITEFLKSAESPQASAWEARRSKWNASLKDKTTKYEP